MNESKFVVKERWHGKKLIVGLHTSDCYKVQITGRRARVKPLPADIKNVEDAKKWVKNNKKYKKYEKHLECPCLRKYSL